MIESFQKLARSLTSIPRCQENLLIGVDGAGGSGKSTFALSLGVAFRVLGLSAAVIHMDDFYLPSAQRPPDEDSRKTLADHFDWERLRSQVLIPLRQGKLSVYQRYDWESDALAEWHKISSGGVVIVEGISTLRKELLDYYDFKVWVESPRPTRLERGIARDGENARPIWEQYWMPMEERYFNDHRPFDKADLWIDGSGDGELDSRGFTYYKYNLYR